MTKKELRRRLLDRLRRQPEEKRQAKSVAIGRRLRRLPLYRKAGAILCYVAIDGEVETRPIIRQALADGKRLAVPVTLPRSKRLIAAEIQNPETDLSQRGPFGIPQPAQSIRRRVPARELDLILVPGVAFDRRGRRLGRGGGYFDRFLSTIPPEIPSVGLAFRFQRVKNIPWESHDRPVSRVITE